MSGHPSPLRKAGKLRREALQHSAPGFLWMTVMRSVEWTNPTNRDQFKMAKRDRKSAYFKYVSLCGDRSFRLPRQVHRSRGLGGLEINVNKLARAPGSCERVCERGWRPKMVNFFQISSRILSQYCLSELEPGQGEVFEFSCKV
jgi:hypothetical protein